VSFLSKSTLKKQIFGEFFFAFCLSAKLMPKALELNIFPFGLVNRQKRRLLKEIKALGVIFELDWTETRAADHYGQAQFYNKGSKKDRIGSDPSEAWSNAISRIWIRCPFRGLGWRGLEKERHLYR
jgi:hypothetical protein